MGPRVFIEDQQIALLVLGIDGHIFPLCCSIVQWSPFIQQGEVEGKVLLDNTMWHDLPCLSMLDLDLEDLGPYAIHVGGEEEHKTSSLSTSNMHETKNPSWKAIKKYCTRA